MEETAAPAAATSKGKAPATSKAKTPPIAAEKGKAPMSMKPKTIAKRKVELVELRLMNLLSVHHLYLENLHGLKVGMRHQHPRYLLQLLGKTLLRMIRLYSLSIASNSDCLLSKRKCQLI